MKNFFAIVIIAVMALVMLWSVGGEAVPEYEDTEEHIVRSGETLWSIANLYVDAEKHDRRIWIYEVREINDIDPDIMPGQRITVPIF